MLAIYKREMRSYFVTPAGYVFLAMFYAISGYYFFGYNLYGSTTDFSYIFSALFTFMIFLTPLLTMKLFSEEKHNKTDQALLTAPVGLTSIVLGKFCAAMTMYLTAQSITLIYMLIISTKGPVEYAVFFGHFIGFFLFGMALCALGSFVSSITESQIVAAVGSMGLGMLFLFIDSIGTISQNTILMKICNELSFYQHFRDFTTGLLNVVDILFYLSITILFLFLIIRRKKGIRPFLVTIGIVICLVLINIGATVLSEKYPLKLDLTTNKIFQLSQSSIDYLDTVKKPVDITILNTETNFTQGGDYYTQALSVIKQYAQYNKQISIKFEDSSANPDQINNIIVQCGDKSAQLTAYDIFNIETSWYGGNITSSNAEQALTGAIMNVTDDNKIKVAFISGHGESGDEALEVLLQKNGFETERVSLLTTGIPTDASIVILSSPLRDITTDEAITLDKFLENNSKYDKNLMYFASLDQTEPLPNLELWLEKWGLSIGKEPVSQTNPNLIINQNSYFGIADFDDTTLTEKMFSTKIPIAVPLTRSIELKAENNEGYSTRSLLSYAVKDNPISVAAISTFQKDTASSNVLAFGTPLLLDGSLFENTSLSNADYMLSAINTLTKRENTISIAPKVIGGGQILITTAELLIWSVILAIIFPIFVLSIGIYIWIRRKKQ